jgi:hypothetical protein
MENLEKSKNGDCLMRRNWVYCEFTHRYYIL